MTAVLLVLAAIISYFFGMLPWPIIVSRYFFHKDVRSRKGKSNPTYEEFSARFGAKGMAILIAFDVIFGIFACLISGALLSVRELTIIGRLFGIFCYLMGYCFPFLWLFKGRRGVLPAVVMLLFADWRVAVCCAVVYGIAVVFIRYEAVAACGAAILSALFMWVFGGTGLAGLICLLCAFIIIARYADSLRRLIDGTEKQLGSFFPKNNDDYADDDDEF